ncbi:iron complex outermembrane recepter protein [Methylomagnum ishizawai]|uniref:Iron complex outermembrane recepter protein n=1 Tax=Methylomagnum ishizawai TaxID=1760988 RepID=A0A1Y6CY14_9GAMM|nr:TonB-dependent receptor [Methylomagnum ishizawai]SMF95548.1 iron complex outermembrane recepter protein [Methylomagnum ishizawai]
MTTLMHRLLPALLCLVLLPPPAGAADLGEEDEKTLRQVYGGEDMITIATGNKQHIATAPAVTTVITAADIKAMGATDIDEVLEAVPGLHVARSNFGNPIYTIRGVYSLQNPQVLVLVNGIPITNLFVGDRNQIWGGMPVQAIAQVEVIRGPGSALYGSDAFAGVINIITKTKEDIKGTEIGGRVGSFDTYDGWALHGDTWAGFDVAAMVEFHDTQGQRQTVASDAQSYFDQRGNTLASLAPGPMNLQRQNLDARLDLARGYWRVRGGLQHRANSGTAAGLSQALDPSGRFSSDRWNADITYHNPEFTEHWDVTAQASYFDTSQQVSDNVYLYPKGATFPTGSFADGVIGNPEVFERHTRSSLSGFYSGFDRHILRLGLGFNYLSIYDVRESKNYTIVSPGIPSPLGGLVDVSNTSDVFLKKGSRTDTFIFLQDEWRFSNDWQLTTGVRYDYYSDFGNTVNPRLALVWETRQDLTSKLLYGRSFRAPSFAETRNINNPVDLGNPHLKPETMNTIELAFDYHPTDKLRFGFNLFNYWWSDIIRFVPDPGGGTSTAQNAGRQTSHGLELEADWQATEDFKLTGWYAYQHSIDESTHHDPGYAPHHQLYLRGDWEFLPNWHLNPQVKWILDRERAADDNRPPIPDYSLVDLTLRRKYLMDHWEIAFSVRNLFDSDAREPSPAGSSGNPAFIPYDLPLAGRNFYGEIRFEF